MHRDCGTHNRAPRWTFTVPCKPEARPGAREESASPAWLAAPAMNARDTTEMYIWRPYTGCGPTLYRKCHSHNTPGKRHDNTWVKLLAGNCTTSSTRQRVQVWQKCKIQKTSVTVYGYPLEYHVTFGDRGFILFDKILVQITWWKIKGCLWNTTVCPPPRGNKVEKAFFSFKVEVKVTRSLTF